MAIQFPTVLPLPLLNGNSTKGGETFKRSEFDYAIRQRASYCAAYKVNFSFLLDSAEKMRVFKDFYYDSLKNGVQIFSADWEIEGFNSFKEFRFSSMYSVADVGCNNYIVKAEFEMITKIKDL